jgi:hypothetical protein
VQCWEKAGWQFYSLLIGFLLELIFMIFRPVLKGLFFGSQAGIWGEYRPDKIIPLKARI